MTERWYTFKLLYGFLFTVSFTLGSEGQHPLQSFEELYAEWEHNRNKLYNTLEELLKD